MHKLCSLHLKRGDYTEAAFTLKLHNELISWSYDPLPDILRFPLRYPMRETHCQLKEALLNDIISYFIKGEVKHLITLNGLTEINYHVNISRCGNVL